MEYRGYKIKPNGDKWIIYDFGIPISDADSVEHAKKIIDSGKV